MDTQATISERIRTRAGEALRRTADVVDGTAVTAEVTSVGADGKTSDALTSKRRRGFIPPLASLRGYRLEDLPHDIAAGAVVAALSIPIAMGYAEVIGLPAVFGLYASIIAPLVFALVTGTRRIVFGMDSAVSAVTGGMLVSSGLAYASEGVSAIIPLVTVLTGIFLALFSLLGAGRLARFIPVPVMHGFIAGVSLTVIVTQIPGLIGTSADMSGGFVSDVREAFGSIPYANGPSTLIAAISLGLIVHLKKTMPKVPAALVVLVVTTVICAVLHLDEDGVSILGAIDAGFPLPTIPHVEAQDLPSAIGCAVVIAVVASIESLLCLETFSMKAGVRPNGSRELLSFGVGNAAAGLFGCPPCSASLSRTAAGISAGSRTQATSIAAAVVVAAVVLVLSPALYYLPRPALSAIVVVALVDVVDFDKAARYARHMLLEFLVFMISAVVVLVYGAITGVIVGTVASLVVAFYRDRRRNQQALLGVAYDEDAFGKKGAKPKVGYAILKLEGHLSFLNIDGKIDALLDDIDEATRAVIVKLNKVDSLDSTAADKLILLVDMLHARHMHVKIVRKVRPTNDSLTRYEMRRIMRGAKFYPNMSAALAGLSRDLEREEREALAAAEAARIEQEEQAAAALLMSPHSEQHEDAVGAAAGTDEAQVAQGADDAAEHLDGQPRADEDREAAAGQDETKAAKVLDNVSAAAHELTGRVKNMIVKDVPLSIQSDDRIVMTVQEPFDADQENLEGKLAYIRAREAILFDIDLAAPSDSDPTDPDKAAADKSDKGKKAKAAKSGQKGGKKATKKNADRAADTLEARPAFSTATLRREKTGEVLAEFADGSWRWYYPPEALAPAIDLIEGLALDAR